MMGLAALLLTTWSACSDDTDIPGGENPEEARAYTTVTIAVPNGVAETRAGTTADTDDNTTEAGSEDEYKVKTANLYLFPGGASSSFGSAKSKEIISIDQFTQMTASTADAKTIVWTSMKTALTPGDYRIYIVVNGTVNGVDNYHSDCYRQYYGYHPERLLCSQRTERGVLFPSCGSRKHCNESFDRGKLW